MATIKIDKEACIGCGACESEAPKLFEMKEGKAVVKKQPNTDEETKKAKQAKDLCPTDAISIS